MNKKTIALFQAFCLSGIVFSAGAQDSSGIEDNREGIPSDEQAPYNTTDVVSMHWKLDIEYQSPKTIEITNADDSTQWYWYLLFDVENNTEEVVHFVPIVDIASDEGEIIRAGDGVSNSVYDALRQKLANPLVLDWNNLAGEIMPGEDYVKTGVLAWPVTDGDMDAFSIYFAGLSGEAEVRVDPVTGEVIMRDLIDPITGEPITDIDGNSIQVPEMAHRTRVLRYACGGTTRFPEVPDAHLIEDTEVMR